METWAGAGGFFDFDFLGIGGLLSFLAFFFDLAGFFPDLAGFGLGIAAFDFESVGCRLVRPAFYFDHYF